MNLSPEQKKLYYGVDDEGLMALEQERYSQGAVEETMEQEQAAPVEYARGINIRVKST